MKNALAALLIGIAMVITSWILGEAVKNRNNYNDTIKVTGLGKKDFTSDLIVWTGSFSRKAFDLKTAYQQLNQDREIIKNYFSSKGLDPEQLVFSSVDINKEHDYEYLQDGRSKSTFTGYRLTQSITIESKEVDKVENLSREVTELINQGVEFYSNQPQFYYTGLSDLKIEMIAAATKDATMRARQIAENADAELGDLKTSSMGVFQIIAQNSNEDYSWGGTYNTFARDKTATITLRLEFYID